MNLDNLNDETMLEVTILLDKDDIVYDVIAGDNDTQTISISDDEIQKMSHATSEHIKSLGFEI